jgi:imidazolonepropionase-like amidohydrolase
VNNGLVIDGTGSEPIPNGLVAIDGNRIVYAGPSSEFKMPKDIPLLDAEGGTILPGIINSHSHKDMGAGTRRIMFLLEGVTSVCDMMIPISSMHNLEEEGIQSGPAARGFKAGPIITVPGGYPGVIFGVANSYEIQGAHEAELAVLDLYSQGADYIKVALEPGIFVEPWPFLDLVELRTIIDTAHSKNLLVRAHVNNAELDLALEAGVDVIEHVPMPSFSPQKLGVFFDDAGKFRMDPYLEEQLLQMVEQEIVLVPTLDVIIDDTYKKSEAPPEVEVVNQAVLGVVGFFHNLGGTIALGNDYGNSGVMRGMPLREMELLHDAGLSRVEVIEAATKHAAYVCGQSDYLGTLESGKLADLIVVEGNPLEDLTTMLSIMYVVKDGEIAVTPED